MSRDRKVQIVTALVVCGILCLAIVRKAASRPPDLDPEGAVYAMFNAARAGDVKSYLASHTGQLEATLRQTLAESGESGFQKYLRDTNASVKGIAVSDVQVTGGSATARVEYIYQDRNEAQMMYLEKTAAGWKIARTDQDQRVRTLIPYGTPVR